MVSSNLIFFPEVWQLACLIDAANVLYGLMELRGQGLRPQWVLR